MSATNRGAVRVEKDFYPTPAWATKLILSRVNWPVVEDMMEPCKGQGAILDLVPKHVYKYWCELSEGVDYLTTNIVETDLTITNPPYDIATPFLKRALEFSDCVIFLLRINYLGSRTRKAFLELNRPSHLYVLSERPSFVDVCAGFEKPVKQKGCGAAYQKDAHLKTCPECGGKVKAGTDATEYAWICWDRGNFMNDEPGVYFL